MSIPRGVIGWCVVCDCAIPGHTELPLVISLWDRLHGFIKTNMSDSLDFSIRTFKTFGNSSFNIQDATKTQSMLFPCSATRKQHVSSVDVAIMSPKKTFPHNARTVHYNRDRHVSRI